MSKLNKKLKNELKLRSSNNPHICAEDFVLLNGVAYIPASQSKMKKLTCRSPNYCYANSHMAAIAPRSKWVYNEGFAITGAMGLVFEHAWLTLESEPGLAFDPTWTGTANTVYLGIPFSKKYIIDSFKRSRSKYYPVIYAPWNGSPLLTGEHKLENAVHEAFLSNISKKIRETKWLR